MSPFNCFLNENDLQRKEKSGEKFDTETGEI